MVAMKRTFSVSFLRKQTSRHSVLKFYGGYFLNILTPCNRVVQLENHVLRPCEHNHRVRTRRREKMCTIRIEHYISDPPQNHPHGGALSKESRTREKRLELMVHPAHA